MAIPTTHIDGSPTPAGAHGRFRIKPFAYGLAGYFMFGVGYIGYMTFVIALLKEQRMQPSAITAFYTLLGLAVVASSRIWAGMLDRFDGKEAKPAGAVGVWEVATSKLVARIPTGPFVSQMAWT